MLPQHFKGYQKYPKGEKAPINLLKLISMVKLERKTCFKMINGVEKQYPKANQSVIQKLNMMSPKI